MASINYFDSRWENLSYFLKWKIFWAFQIYLIQILIFNEIFFSGSGLNSLVEDKEIASRAVAFVINSTRKGIVSLCTDVANLLRAKRR